MNSIRKLIALGVILVAASACTPQEVAFWHALYEEDPAAAERMLGVFGLEGVAVADDPAVRDSASPDDSASMESAPGTVAAPVVVQQSSSFRYTAAIDCGPPRLTLTNTDDEMLHYFVYYGASQTPLVRAEVSETYPETGPPPIEAGETVVVDLTASIGTTTWIALDRGWGTGGVVAHVDVVDC